MTNKNLLVIIAVLLVGIFAILAIEAANKDPDEKVADNISHFMSEVSEEIDDASSS